MVAFRDMTPDDRALVLDMVDDFYHTDAADHVVPSAVMERTFQAAVDPREPLLRGILVEQDGETAGFLYVTVCFASEVGGRCLFVEELFLRPAFRGRGLGGEILRWLRAAYPDVSRFRLEVAPGNDAAARLYQRLGYSFLSYRQMVLDSPPAPGVE